MFRGSLNLVVPWAPTVRPWLKCCLLFPDYSELHAPVPASVPRGVREPEGGGRRADAELQDLRLPGDQVHRRHRIPEPQGETHICIRSPQKDFHRDPHSHYESTERFLHRHTFAFLRHETGFHTDTQLHYEFKEIFFYRHTFAF